MPHYLFQHHFILTIEKTVAHLQLMCQDTKSNPIQKLFNTEVQVQLMKESLNRIKAIEVNTGSVPDWPTYRNAISQVLLDIKQKAVDAKEAKNRTLEKSDTPVDITDIEDFDKKLLDIYDSMREEMQKDYIIQHCDQIADLYTQPNTSPYLNQLINITLEYRFYKIQEKHVENLRGYRSKHLRKMAILEKIIGAWQDLHSKGNVHIKTNANGLLTDLVIEENIIENDKSDGVLGFIRGTLTEMGKTTYQWWQPKENKKSLLSKKLLALKTRYALISDEKAREYPEIAQQSTSSLKLSA